MFQFLINSTLGGQLSTAILVCGHPSACLETLLAVRTLVVVVYVP